jgi:hypothetical protein
MVGHVHPLKETFVAKRNFANFNLHYMLENNHMKLVRISQETRIVTPKRIVVTGI